MSRKVKCHESEAEKLTAALSVTQEQALVLLLAGKSQTDTAKEVGVTLETVNRWLHNDAAFIATLNARRRDVWTANCERLRSLIGQALTTLEGLLNADNEATRMRTASVILKATTRQADAPTGPITVEEVEQAWQNAEQNAAWWERQAEISRQIDDHGQRLLDELAGLR
jgi:hypothetical protein